MRQNKINIMPMVTNHGFSPQVAHDILSNSIAQDRAINVLLEEDPRIWQSLHS